MQFFFHRERSAIKYRKHYFLHWFYLKTVILKWNKISQKTCPFFSRMRKAKHTKTKLIKKKYIWIANGEINLYFLLLLNQHKQSSLKIHVIFLENLVTKKLHHTEEWTGPLYFLSLCRWKHFLRDLFRIKSHWEDDTLWKKPQGSQIFLLNIIALYNSYLYSMKNMSFCNNH